MTTFCISSSSCCNAASLNSQICNLADPVSVLPVHFTFPVMYEKKTMCDAISFLSKSCSPSLYYIEYGKLTYLTKLDGNKLQMAIPVQIKIILITEQVNP
jgi:hypothetical protein